MPHFPLFIDLAGKRCVVIGGGTIAQRRVEHLLPFGAVLTVIAPEISAALQSLSREQSFTLVKREYAGRSDLSGSYLVLAASNNHALNKQVVLDAQSLGLFANAADAAELCSFFFPAIVQRGEIVAGISTSGLNPTLARRLRQQLDAFWPQTLAAQVQSLTR
ncbi:hypothetical protein FACS1894200_11170 [Spirochaetia bacterium]|nr:hypothetical protein FACS1894200_11170 [Spirochaetia bacterium]